MRILGLLSALSLLVIFTSTPATPYAPGTHNIEAITSHKVKDTIDSLYAQYGQRLLVVFDDDDTLERPGANQYLASTDWFNWQSKLLKQNPHSPELVADNFAELLRVDELIFDLSKMQPTEQHLSHWLHHYQAAGVPMMVVTARGPEMADATQAEFQQQQWNFSRTAPQASRNPAIQLSYRFTPNAQTCPTAAGHRPILYDLGTLYVSGQNKAASLMCLLHVFHQQNHQIKLPKAIVFIDDEGKNSRAFQQFMDKHYPHIRVITLHDRHVSQHQKATSEKERKQSTQTWRRIKRTLKKALSDSSI
jgi:hypothetical protein